MARVPVKKASLISVGELPKVVDSAVKAAHARLGQPVPTGPLIKKWEIYGYRIRDRLGAHELASAVAAEVSRAGVPVKPAVLVLDRDILCGFIEPPNMPRERIF